MSLKPLPCSPFEHPSSLSCPLPAHLPISPAPHQRAGPSKAGLIHPLTLPPCRSRSGTVNVMHSYDLGSSSWSRTRILSLTARAKALLGVKAATKVPAFSWKCRDGPKAFLDAGLHGTLEVTGHMARLRAGWTGGCPAPSQAGTHLSLSCVPH